MKVQTLYRADGSGLRVVNVLDNRGAHVEYQIRQDNDVLACATGLESILCRVCELEAEGGTV